MPRKKKEKSLKNFECTVKNIFLGEVKSKNIFPLIILHLISNESQYGNKLISKIKEMSGNIMTVNPNTIYPLLTRMEELGYVKGKWDRPKKPYRKYYSITKKGFKKYIEIKVAQKPWMEKLEKAVKIFRKEIYS